MPANLSSFLNAASIDDTVINNAGGAVGNTNTAVQAIAAASGISTVTPLTAGVAITANSVAFGSAATMLQTDTAAGNYQNAIGDGITLIGDALGVFGGIVGALGLPTAAVPISFAANAVTVVGLGVDNISLSTAKTALNSLTSEGGDAIEDSAILGAAFGAVSSTAVGNLDTFETDISTTLSDLTTAINDFGTSSESSALTTLATAITGLESPLAALYDSTGEVAPSITTTVNSDDTFSITNSGSSTLSAGAIDTNGSGDVIGVTGAQSGGGNITVNQAVDGSGDIAITKVSDNSGGGTLYTDVTGISAAGQVTASISGTGDTADLTDASISLGADAAATILGMGDSIALGTGAALGLGGLAVGGEGLTVSSGTEGLAFGSGMNVLVNSGNTATVTGTDGTLTATNASGTITNTINWNGGSSEVQNYGVSGSTSTQTNLGYTGSNGTGTQLFDETRTDTSGTISDSITGAGYYNPTSGQTWNSIAADDINGIVLNGGQLQAVDIALGEGGGITPGDPIYLPTSAVSVGSTPIALSSAGVGLSGQTYSYIEQTGKAYSVGAYTNGTNLGTVYALTTNGDSLADTQPGTTTVAYSTSNSGTVTLASSTGGGHTDTMTLGDNGNDDSFQLGGSAGFTFAPGPITSLVDNSESFTFGNSSGSMGTVGYNDATSTIFENISNTSISVIGGSLISAAGSGDTINLGADDTLTLNGDSGDTVNLDGLGTLSVGSGTGDSSFALGTLSASFAAGAISSVEDSSTPWFNLAAGGSDQLQVNPVSGISTIFANFGGSNGTGVLNSYTEDLSNGTSNQTLYADLPSSEAQQLTYYTGENLTGSLTSAMINLTAGGSQAQYYYPTYGISVAALDTTGYNSSGEWETGQVDLTIGLTDYLNYYYTSGAMTYFNESLYDGLTQLAWANFTPSGGYIAGDDGGELADDGFIGDGGAFEFTKSANATSPATVATIAQFDAQLAQDPTATQAAENAWLEAYTLTQPSGSSENTATALYEGVKWNTKVITWSLATTPGGTSSAFSSYMSPQYKSLVEKAFAAWGAAAGITFEQVADSSQSDIRLGFADFNTSSSGVLGYTSYQEGAGQALSDVIIRLEDPTQDPLVAGSSMATVAAGTSAGVSSGATYSGTQASLYQLLLHEIGHALGLADNNDPNSVMYYQGSTTGTLDSNDVAGMQMLYGSAQPPVASSTLPSGASLTSMFQQMTQATAAFPTDVMASTTSDTTSTLAMPPQGLLALATSQALH